MSSNALDQLSQPRTPAPGHVGQATSIEHVRAETEVKAAAALAQQFPRNVAAARTAMIESCREHGLASRAFFRYNRAGSQISGPSIHFARELARCWGNLQYGITELARDDVKGESEMRAFAWDVQTNAYLSTTFIVKHVREATAGNKPLTGGRDIYELLANMGARRLREQILGILPTWYVEQGKAICVETAEAGDGTPLPDRIARAVGWFESAGVTLKQLEHKIGLRKSMWAGKDVATLEVIARSLTNGESLIGDEFTIDNSDEVGADAIRAQSAAAQQQTTAVPPAPPTPETPIDSDVAGEKRLNPASADEKPADAGITPTQHTQIGNLLRDGLGMDRAGAIAYVRDTVHRDVKSRNDLTYAEAEKVLDAIDRDMKGLPPASDTDQPADEDTPLPDA